MKTILTHEERQAVKKALKCPENQTCPHMRNVQSSSVFVTKYECPRCDAGIDVWYDEDDVYDETQGW